MKALDKTWLLKLADALKNSERAGRETDSPEGARWITMSDTLANEIERKLREIAGGGTMSEPKLCPFRNVGPHGDPDPCLQETCAMWRVELKDVPGTARRDVVSGGISPAGAPHGAYWKTVYDQMEVAYCGLAGKP